jgi:hypothetical protein
MSRGNSCLKLDRILSHGFFRRVANILRLSTASCESGCELDGGRVDGGLELISDIDIVEIIGTDDWEHERR